MKVDALKLERQLIGSDKWFNSSQYGADKDRKGCINYATGVGKTYTAVLIMKRLLQEPLHNIIVLVPLEALIKQWEDELRKQLPVKDLKRVTVFSAFYVLQNQIKASTNTLVVDELHLFLGEGLITTINGELIRATNHLALTATYEDPKGRHKVYKDLYPVIDTISEKEAIEKGFISDYKEFNLGIELNEKEKQLYDKYSDVIKTHLNKFDRNLDLATSCLNGGTYKGKQYEAAHFLFGWAKYKGWRSNLDMRNSNEAQIEELWNPNKIMNYAVTLMKAIRLRKDMLYVSESKVQATLDIIEKYKGVKTMVFAEKTKAADLVEEFLNKQIPGYCVAYHSNLPTQLLPSPKTGKLIKFGSTRLKKRAINRIKTGISKVIATGSSLDTGFDVDDIVIGIIISSTSNFNKQRQRSGRIKRKPKDAFIKDGQKPIINIYIKDTVDEKWLHTRQSKSTNPMFWVDSVDEIDFNAKLKEEFNLNDVL